MLLWIFPSSENPKATKNLCFVLRVVAYVSVTGRRFVVARLQALCCPAAQSRRLLLSLFCWCVQSSHIYPDPWSWCIRSSDHIPWSWSRSQSSDYIPWSLEQITELWLYTLILGADHRALTIYPDPWSRSEIRLRDCVSETYPKAPWMGECAVPPCELTGLCLAGGHHGPLPHDRTVLPWKFRQYRSSLHDAEGEIGNCRQNCVILTPWKKTVWIIYQLAAKWDTVLGLQTFMSCFLICEIGPVIFRNLAASKGIAVQLQTIINTMQIRRRLLDSLRWRGDGKGAHSMWAGFRNDHWNVSSIFFPVRNHVQKWVSGTFSFFLFFNLVCFIPDAFYTLPWGMNA